MSNGQTDNTKPAPARRPGLEAKIRAEVSRTVVAEIAALKTEIAAGLAQLTQQVDTRIEQAVDAKLNAVRDEIKGVIQQVAAARAGATQPAPAASVQPEATLGAQGDGRQPAGRGGILEALAPLVPLAQQLAQPPANPMAPLVAQMAQLGDLISAVDKIRGGSTQAYAGMSPKTALDWAKWGHQLAASGAPVPAFPTATHEEPPAARL